jgi:uncharacterized FAD-dependent dehydrogenase
MFNYKIEQIRVSIDYTEKSLKNKIARTLSIFPNGMIPNEIISVKILRKSLDSRQKIPVYVISAEIETQNPVAARCAIPVNDAPENKTLDTKRRVTNKLQPVVVGFGPAGISAAYILAKAGLKPIVFERGEEISSRQIKVEKFWNAGILDENSNVLFGEGGAGLFSDGKLTSRSKNIESRNVFLEMLVRHGASDSILTDTKAHIGTDKLRQIIKSIREEIQELGGEIKFNSTLTDIKTENGKLTGIYIKSNGSSAEFFETESVILAIGHSARETYQMLEKHLMIEAKPFAIGVRVEFEQEIINRLQYGKSAMNMSAASFNLTYNPNNNFKFQIPNYTLQARACYTFCMCPGGQVISCSAKNGTLSTNGMSYANRSMKFGNAAFLVPIGANELSFNDLEKIEKTVFERGGKNYSLPAQNLASFLFDKENIDYGFSPHRYKLTDISGILPDFVEKTLKTAIPKMLNSMGKIDFSRAAIFAAETGSSSAARILRNPETLQSVSIQGLFPCGEGAGYAGGIVSSGIDGIRCANKIL